MALPKLNDSIKYSLKIPSTQQEIEFRPYVMKEQKVLLLAKESKDPKQMLSALVDTIVACVYQDIDKSKLTTFDAEYLFMKIRAKSEGEKSKISVACTECEESNELEINLDEIEIPYTGVDPVIKLNDTMSLKMKYIYFEEMMANSDIVNGDTAQQLTETVRLSMEALLTDDERIAFKDEPREEVIEFIDSLSSPQTNAIMEYIKDSPKLSHKTKFNCSSCNHENDVSIEGIQSFF